MHTRAPMCLSGILITRFINQLRESGSVSRAVRPQEQKGHVGGVWAPGSGSAKVGAMEGLWVGAWGAASRVTGATQEEREVIM